MPVVLPARERRQRHQDRFGAAAGLQAERSAAVVDEIEFDITPATVQLEVALALAERRRAPARDDRQICRQKMIADAALIGEAALEAPLVQIVEEQAADAARLVAVLEKEIPVAPLLVARVHVVAERRARLLGRAVPVQDVFVERIVRGEIESAAEPPGNRVLLGRAEEPHVGVSRRDVRVQRMKYQRHTGSEPLRILQFGSLRRRARRQLCAHHVRKIYAGLLEERAIAEHATFAAAAFGALPRIPSKPRRAVRLLDSVTDAVLKSAQIGQYCRDVGSGGRHDYFFVGVRFAAAFFFGAGAFAGAAFAAVFAGVFAAGFAADLAECCGSGFSLTSFAAVFAAPPAALLAFSAAGAAAAAPAGAAVFFANLPKRPLPRSGAAAISSLHSSSVNVFGSRSLGILAFFTRSVMYGP